MGGGFVPVFFQLLQHLPPGLVDLHAHVGQSRISTMDANPDIGIETSLPIRTLVWRSKFWRSGSYTFCYLVPMCDVLTLPASCPNQGKFV